MLRIAFVATISLCLPMISKEDQIELMHRIAGGDQNAFVSLYDAVSSPLYTLAMTILHQEQDAAEVIQDVLMAVWQQAQRYSIERAAPFTWLVVMTRNKAIDRLRQRSRRPVSSSISSTENGPDWDIQDPAPDPLKALTVSEDASALGGFLQEISPEQRQAITLAYWQGLTHVEIAEHLGQSIGTIKSRIRDGLSKIRYKAERRFAR